MKSFYELLCLLWFKNNQNNFVVYQPNGNKILCLTLHCTLNKSPSN
jgi:hypothetical protein